MSWFEGVQNVNSEKEFTVQKAINPNLIKEEDLLKAGFIIVATDGCLEKAERDTSKLTKKEIWVTRGGKSFKQTVYVKTGEEEKKVEPPIGEEVTPTVKGMNVVKYSDKSLLITGDTYVNKETLREIKSEVKAGVWNRKLNGWVFPSKFLDTILGYLYSDQKENGNDEKAEAIKNQKNAGLESGDTANVGGIDINIEENVSTNEGTKYKATLDDGTKLDGVDEKVIDKEPQANDKKIAEATNNASAESRVATAKKIYGIQPIEDIHNYSLSEYMGLHGISQEDIDRIVGGLKKAKSGNSKKSSGGSSKTYTKKDQKDGLTKQQLIRKLVYAHYQAVKKAIDNGDEVKESVLDTYEDLATLYKTKRKEMTEETKRKISEALKKNGVEEDKKKKSKAKSLLDDLESVVEEIQKEKGSVASKSEYTPKDGEIFEVKSPPYTVQREPVKIKSKDYTDVPPMDISIPKQKDILSKPKPYFIPEIDEYGFANRGHTLSAVKIDEDKYLVALDGFERGRGNYSASLDAINKTGNFAVMSLDVFTATQKYYQSKAKEEVKQKAIEEHNELIQSLKGRIETAKQGGDLQKVDLLQENLEHYSKKKPKAKRITVYKDNKMSYDQMHMIQVFNRTDDGNFIGNREVWGIFRERFKEVDQKSKDLDMQQEHDESSFTKGRETSYGDSGTKDTLLDEYGVKIKRQNGDEITKSETEQIKKALDVTSNLFGKNVEMNKEFGLKISHSGDVLMHAMKAVGVFFPYYNAIGVSEKYGDNQFQFTFGHEYAHFMDYWIGKQTGNHYASDKQGTTANKIASTFRSNMNEKQSSVYQNRTCECFARALEQYVATETYGSDVEKAGFDGAYKDKENHVNDEVYKNQIKPLIEQFLQENKEFLKSDLFDLLK